MQLLGIALPVSSKAVRVVSTTPMVLRFSWGVPSSGLDVLRIRMPSSFSPAENSRQRSHDRICNYKAIRIIYLSFFSDRRSADKQQSERPPFNTKHRKRSDVLALADQGLSQHLSG